MFHWYDFPLLCGYRSDGFAWVRLFGFGFHIKDTDKHMLLFSERNKLRCGLRFGKWHLSFLTP